MLARERSPASRAARGVSVLARRRPSYDPLGLRAGGFTVFPTITLTPEFSSNVFRAPNATSDVLMTGKAEVLARSNWSVHQLVLDGALQRRQFASETSQNATSFRARAAGRLDVDRVSAIDLSAVHQRIIQDRGGVGEVLSPILPTRYDQTGATAAARTERGAISLAVNGAYDQYKYATIGDPAQQNQDFRDYDRYQLGGTVGYKVTPDWAVTLSARNEWRRFSAQATPRRDVDMLQVLGGLNSTITSLIRGRLAVGYLRANFHDPLIPNRSGLAFDAELTYLYSELTTIRFMANRELRNVASANSADAIVTSIMLVADHELYRNVIVSPTISYERASYASRNASARSIIPEITARWLINPHLRANFDIRYQTRTGRGFPTDRNFEAVNVTTGITFQF